MLEILGRGDGLFTLADRQHPGRYRIEAALSILDDFQNPIGRNQAGVQDGIAGRITGECEFDHPIFERWTVLNCVPGTSSRSTLDELAVAVRVFTV